MKIAIVIPVHNRRATTLNCLSQLKNTVVTDGADIHIVVVDDGSTDGTSAAIKEFYPEVVVLRGDGKLWWTGAVNMGVEYALTQNNDSILMLNDDLEFEKNFLTEMLQVANDNPAALVSSVKLFKLMNGREQIIAAGFNVVGPFQEVERLNADKLYKPEIMDDIISCDILTGASLLVPVSVFKKIGIFDAKKFPHSWGDFEFTRRSSIATFKCLVAVKSKVYGDYNQNYAVPFLLNSTKKEYILSLFNSTKYYHGFKSLYRSSYMHKNVFIGTILYLRRLMGLFKNVFLKSILPRRILILIYR